MVIVLILLIYEVIVEILRISEINICENLRFCGVVDVLFEVCYKFDVVLCCGLYFCVCCFCF